VIRAETEEQLIEDVKAHAQRFHGHAPSREEILNSAHPVAEDGA
jgi:predicted small metal-binding protein